MTTTEKRIELPEMPARPVVTGRESVRYEDITQDGRLRLLGMPHTLGLLWRDLMSAGPYRDLAREGTLAILTHLELRGGEGPIAVKNPLEVRACHRMAHTVDEQGAVDRILLDMWAELDAPRARTHGPQPDGAGETIRAGSLFARHVFSRPFAPPAQRKVRRLQHPDLPEVPEHVERWSPPQAATVWPDAADAFGDAAGEASRSIAFSLDHTDSNQHVNSLVYPRMFEDAAHAHLADVGGDPAPMMRALSIGFRKPCFAGERHALRLSAFAVSDPASSAGAAPRVGVSGSFTPRGASEREPAHTYLCALFYDQPTTTP